jgi:hypothetical protein
VSAVAERHAPAPHSDDSFTDDEVEAGSEELVAQFGRALAQATLAGDVTKYSTVLATDAATALLKLKLLNAQAAYQRRYSKIINQKKD